MPPTRTDILHVPGTQLYYEVRGSGPTLLMIVGGGGDSAGFHGIADVLAEAYTVVTYDRRGFMKSVPDDPEGEVRVETHGDDAHHLLAALTTEAAYVFGSSGGGLIALDLTARYPQQVRAVIAHEPPAHYLLPDIEAFHDALMEAYEQEGPKVALRQFMAQVDISYEDMEPGVERPKSNREVAAAFADALFKYNVPAVRRYKLDFDALKDAPGRIVLGGGGSGRKHVDYRSAVAVAERLGTAFVEFPGHHTGYFTHPRAFAAKVREVINDE